MYGQGSQLGISMVSIETLDQPSDQLGGQVLYFARVAVDGGAGLIPFKRVELQGGLVSLVPIQQLQARIECVERLRTLGSRVRWLRGNLERELIEKLAPRPGGLPSEEVERAVEALTNDQVTFLYGLPERVELELEGLGRVLFCHATPGTTST
jgi:hypothetical protein